MDKITVSRKNVEQAAILERLKNRDITQRTAAAMLKCSVRWVRSKVKRYEHHGIDGLVHRNSGKQSGRKVPAENEGKVLELFNNQLSDAGPTYLSQKVQEFYGVKISNEAVRSILIKHRLWQVNKPRLKHRKRRERRVCLGILIQLDGSPHDWFEGRAPKCTLLVFIDDATSAILWLEFVTGESTEEVMIAAKHYFESSGLPCSFYVDYGSVFSVNTNNPERDKITQFERAMKELGVEVIHARSPQAKGRVERANRTLQDRLVKEMRLHNICSMEDANAFVQYAYIEQHNQLFAVKPTSPDNAHRPVSASILSSALCLKNERILQNDYVIEYQKRLFQLHAEQPTIIRSKDHIMVNHHFDSTIVLSIRKTILNFSEIKSRPVKHQNPKILREPQPYKPSANSRLWVSGKLPLSPSLESRLKPALPAVEAI
jgi:transposase